MRLIGRCFLYVARNTTPYWKINPVEMQWQSSSSHGKSSAASTQMSTAIKPDPEIESVYMPTSNQEDNHAVTEDARSANDVSEQTAPGHRSMVISVVRHVVRQGMLAVIGVTASVMDQRKM